MEEQLEKWMFAMILLSLLVILMLVYRVRNLKACLKHYQDCEQGLRFYSEHDPLTGAKNRRALAKKVIEFEGKAVTVIVCDIDGLKLINDTLGHWVGDQLICRTAKVLNSACPPEAQIFRVGGDEFLVLLQ